MRRDAMRWDAMRCDAMGCDAMRCDAMRWIPYPPHPSPPQTLQFSSTSTRFTRKAAKGKTPGVGSYEFSGFADKVKRRAAGRGGAFMSTTRRFMHESAGDDGGDYGGVGGGDSLDTMSAMAEGSAESSAEPLAARDTAGALIRRAKAKKASAAAVGEWFGQTVSISPISASLVLLVGCTLRCDVKRLE